MRKRAGALLSVTVLGIAPLVALGGAGVAQATRSLPSVAGTPVGAAQSTSLGVRSPTFVGPAATGCNQTGCSLLSGPFHTTIFTSRRPGAAAGGKSKTVTLRDRQMPYHVRPGLLHHALGQGVIPPSVSCQPLGPGCDSISLSSGGAVSVKGINAVDSATMKPTVGNIEPPDQGLCAGNGSVAETNNIGEILVFNAALKRLSGVIPLDTIMGLSARGWSSGGDPSCEYDAQNGGHWFYTEFVSANSYANGGPFTGCFSAVASTCYEGIAVTVGKNPFGPYNVYFLNANFNPKEPGYPYLLNDFAKIGLSRDAFMLFYDEFPQRGKGFGGGFFNGAQEFAFDKNALETGAPTRLSNGTPNPAFNVAFENMALFPTPDGNCDGTNGGAPGATCWYQVIPAQPPDPSQFDNSWGGSGLLLTSLDFFGNGDKRIAAFDWTGLSNLNSAHCSSCSKLKFGGTLISHVEFYWGVGQLAAQQAGPIPLGAVCGAAGLPANPSTTSCPENGLATNGDGLSQVSEANGELWGAAPTEIKQTFGSSSEVHSGAAYWVVNTGSFDKNQVFTLTDQGYVSPAHEDVEFPAIGAEGAFSQDGGDGGAIVSFTLSGNGGPTHADGGGFFPSSAYGRINTASGGLVGSQVNVAALGQAPDDGFTEYADYPAFQNSRPRWGDYGAAIYLPGTRNVYFASEYIQYANCTGSAFNFNGNPTCGGTREGQSNWGTSVNVAEP